MNNKIFTTGEIVTIRTNLNEIEKTLGHPIPGGMIDVSNLKDHVLRPGEVITVCQNIKDIQGKPRRHYSTNSSEGNEFHGEIIMFLLYVIIGGIITLFI